MSITLENVKNAMVVIIRDMKEPLTAIEFFGKVLLLLNDTENTPESLCEVCGFSHDALFTKGESFNKNNGHLTVQ